MKILAHVGVKDEVELIERMLCHLRAIGVDAFIVCDVESTDGTGELLERHRSDDFRIVTLSDNDPADYWYEANLDAIKEADADWVVFLDADEFLLPATGSLRDSLCRTSADALIVHRYNVPVSENGPLISADLSPGGYADVEMIVEPIPDLRKRLSEDQTISWIRAVPAPKVIARQARVGKLTAGMHRLEATDGLPLAQEVAGDLVIAHVPFSSEERFIRKVDNIRGVFRHHGGHYQGGKGWHWHRWAALAEAGELEREFERTIFSPSLIADLRTSGVIRTAADMLEPASNELAPDPIIANHVRRGSAGRPT